MRNQNGQEALGVASAQLLRAPMDVAIDYGFDLCPVLQGKNCSRTSEANSPGLPAPVSSL